MRVVSVVVFLSNVTVKRYCFAFFGQRILRMRLKGLTVCEKPHEFIVVLT